MGRGQERGLRSGFVAGAVASLGMAAIQVIGRFSFGVPTFFDLSENWITQAIPTSVFAFLLDRLQFSAKPLLFVGLILVQIVVGGGLGMLWRAGVGSRDTANRPFLLLGTVSYGVLLWVLTEIIVLPILGQGAFGSRVSTGPAALTLLLFVAYLIYGLILGVNFDAGRALGRTEAVDAGRRRLLTSVVGAGAVAAFGDALVHAFGASDSTPANPTSVDSPGLMVGPTLVAAIYPLPSPSEPWSIPGLSPEITPAKDFYLVSKNLFSDPHVDAQTWSLRIDGLVTRPVQFSYAELLQLPAVEFYQTLECISNPIGGDLISTAWWRGVRLKDLLSLAGANPKTVKVVFHAVDDYADSVPLAAALDPAAALVYQMNRAPLPVGHGYPARVLVPGRYGIKNVKWVNHIELVAEDFKGYWQQRGWTDDGRIHTMSRLDVPKDHSIVNAGRIRVAGISFGGNRGISRVQVSVDEGKSWQDARLKPALGPLTWRLWQYDWQAPKGNGSIFVQATDGAGHAQWPLPQDTVPDGATGQDVHVITIK